MILTSKRNLGIEVAPRSFEINKNQGSIECFLKSADYLNFQLLLIIYIALRPGLVHGFKLDLRETKHLLGHQKCTFKL